MRSNTDAIGQPRLQFMPSSKSVWGAAIVGPVLYGTIWITISPRDWGCSGLAAGVLIQLLAVSVITDLSERKIPNWLTYTAFGWALLINVAGQLLPEHQWWLGSVGLGQSLAGGFGLLAIMFVIFSISGGGAGDVKLAACLGALLGWNLALNAMLYSFVFAGAGMLCAAIWIQGPLFITAAFLRSIGNWLLPTVILPPGERQLAVLSQKFPLAPFFAAGTLLAIYWRGV